MSTPASSPDTGNPLSEMLFNIVAPVVILNQLTKRLETEHGALVALVVALAFPIGYGLYDFGRKRRLNIFSLFGFVSILATGGLALLQLDGIWFAVKEAGFPLLLGALVFGSIFWGRPASKFFFRNPAILRLDIIDDALRERNKEAEMERLWKSSTTFIALSFLLSAILNFVLARHIFTPIDPALMDAERAALINEQVARMTWMGYLVIMVPCMLCMGAALWHLVRGITRLTGLEFASLLVGAESDAAPPAQ